VTEKYAEYLESPEVAVIVRDFKAPELTVMVKDFKVPELTVVAKDIKLPDVTIEVTKPAAQKVYVGGQVARPGIVPMVGMLRMHDTVIQAGGALDTADLERVVLIRYNGSPEPDIYAVNLKKIMAGRTPDVMLRPYDVVHLPKTAIAEVNTFAKQYIHSLIPVNFNLIYNINREIEVRSR
jgi:polysaccharide export outer membrane protein